MSSESLAKTDKGSNPVGGFTEVGDDEPQYIATIQKWQKEKGRSQKPWSFKNVLQHPSKTWRLLSGKMTDQDMLACLDEEGGSKVGGMTDQNSLASSD